MFRTRRFRVVALFASLSFVFGAGLVVAAAAWIGGSLLLERDRWWLTLASGLAAGALAGGLLMLVDWKKSARLL